MRSVSATTGLVAACLATQSLARTLTVKNSCGVTIFPAYAGKGGCLSQGGKAAPGGWELEAGGETVLDVPDVCEWLSIRRHSPCDRELNRHFIVATDSL